MMIFTLRSVDRMCSNKPLEPDHSQKSGRLRKIAGSNRFACSRVVGKMAYSVATLPLPILQAETVHAAFLDPAPSGVL